MIQNLSPGTSANSEKKVWQEPTLTVIDQGMIATGNALATKEAVAPLAGHTINSYSVS